MRDGTVSVSGAKTLRRPKVVRVRKWSTGLGERWPKRAAEITQEAVKLDDLGVSKTQSSHWRKESSAERGCVQMLPAPVERPSPRAFPVRMLGREVADGPGFTSRNRFAPPAPPSTGTRAGSSSHQPLCLFQPRRTRRIASR
jgi:hypothetical protein